MVMGHSWVICICHIRAQKGVKSEEIWPTAWIAEQNNKKIVHKITQNPALVTNVKVKIFKTDLNNDNRVRCYCMGTAMGKFC